LLCFNFQAANTFTILAHRTFEAPDIPQSAFLGLAFGLKKRSQPTSRVCSLDWSNKAESEFFKKQDTLGKKLASAKTPPYSNAAAHE
jgi:hypothetical protein